MASPNQPWNEALALQGMAVQNPYLAQSSGTAVNRALLTQDTTPWYAKAPAGQAPVGGVSAPSYTSTQLPSFSGGGSAGGTVSSLGGLSDSNPQMDEVSLLLKGILGKYSKEAAFADAQGQVDLLAQQERQKQMPAIQRSVEGAGTSAGSMQALLSQNLATDIAMKGAAIGGEQAKAYGGIQTQLGSVLAQLASSGDPKAKLMAALLQTQMEVAAKDRETQAKAAAASGSVAGTNYMFQPSSSPTTPRISTAPSTGWYNLDASSPTPGGTVASRW